jgi:two-component system cell cycle sensor histidine kinase/response regulator CckA
MTSGTPSPLRARLREALLQALESVTEVSPDLAGRVVPQRLLDGLREGAEVPGALLLIAAARGPEDRAEARLWLSGEGTSGLAGGAAVDLAAVDPLGRLFAAVPGRSAARELDAHLRSADGEGPLPLPEGALVLVEIPLEEGLRGVLALAPGEGPEPEGLAEGLAAIARPVGGILRAVEVIRRLEARAGIHRSLVETGEQLVHSVGPDGAIQFVNGHWLRTLGYEASRLETMNIFEVIAPSSLAHCELAFQQLFQGEAVIGADIVFLRADGTEVELHGDIFPRLVDGEMVSTQAFLRDVTEERREERRRASGQALLDAVVENAPEAICFLGTDGRVQRINREFTRLFGYEAEEAFERHIDELVVPARLRGEAQDICRLAGSAELIDREVVRRCKDGREITVSLLAAPVVLDGEQSAIVTIYRDVSEQRELEARLARSQRMEALGRLAGGIAHDFNNLLTVVQLSAEYVLEQVPVGSALRPPVEEIAAAGQSAATLTRRLLEFGRRHVVQPEPVDLNQLISQVLPMLRRLLGEDRTLVFELEEGLGAVLTDPGQLEQVLVNLVLNARDAMSGGGRLTLATRAVELGPARATHAGLEPGRYLELLVRDTGTGMPPEVLDRIFEPFFSTKAGDGRGSGLGLATVYGFLEQCRGGIEVESRVGEGSAFRLLLPMLVAAPSAAAPRGPGPLRPSASATVMVVEDEPVIREMVRTVLDRAGHEVLVPEDSAAALALLEGREEPLDLLLTDVVMPGMGGPELARQLRRRQPELRVLFMSGFNDDQLLRRGLERGEAHFLAKPFSAETLVGRVAEVLAQPAAREA